MDSQDQYKIVKESGYGEYKEKGSKFLAYALPFKSESELLNCIEQIKKLHPKSRHFCYAYRLGKDGKVFRTNDDGEPSGTAGKPILGQIVKENLSDAIVIVARHFGGTKLGASGLIHAYKSAAKESLKTATIDIQKITSDYKLIFDYAQMGKIMEIVKKNQLEIGSKEFEESPSIILNLPKSEALRIIRSLKAQLLNVSEDHVFEDTKVEFCKFINLTDA